MKLPKFTLPRFSLPSCRPGALCGRFSVRGFVSFCRMIRIEHSIFALPYAWAGSVMAAVGQARPADHRHGGRAFLRHGHQPYLRPAL